MAAAAVKRPSVFVIMPFKDTLQDLYELGIKPACEAAGADCHRLDELIIPGGMVDALYEKIAGADVLVAEMSEPNENVYYEAGYAHGLGKPVVFMSRSVDAIPFDISQYQHLIYGVIREVKDKLVPLIRHYLDHPNEVARHMAHERMLQHIENYLDDTNKERISFQGIRKYVNSDWTDERLRELIDHNPSRVRFSLLKDNKPGLKRMT